MCMFSVHLMRIGHLHTCIHRPEDADLHTDTHRPEDVDLHTGTHRPEGVDLHTGIHRPEDVDASTVTLTVLSEAGTLPKPEACHYVELIQLTTELPGSIYPCLQCSG